jgi:hypothetical protein
VQHDVPQHLPPLPHEPPSRAQGIGLHEPLQYSSPLHMTSHLPQLSGSFRGLTHRPPQQSRPAPHVASQPAPPLLELPPLEPLLLVLPPLEPPVLDPLPEPLPEPLPLEPPVLEPPPPDEVDPPELAFPELEVPELLAPPPVLLDPATPELDPPPPEASTDASPPCRSMVLAPPQ